MIFIAGSISGANPSPSVRSRGAPAFSGCALFLLLLLMMMAAGGARGAPLPAGTHRGVFDLDGTKLEVVTYKPANYAAGPLLVSFHGLGRNIDSCLEATKTIADRHGMLAVIPLFDRERFPYWRYQALGITRTARKAAAEAVAVEPAAQWTSALILALIDRIRGDEGRPGLDYYLIGHSAGGQLANRFAAFATNGARRIVVANPSSYVQPTRLARFPYGFGGLPPEMADDAGLRGYLAQPMTIFLGTADVLGRDLDLSPPALQQGGTRYERGLNTFHAAQQLARERGWAFNWRLVEVPGAGHDIRRMYGSARASAALFAE